MKKKVYFIISSLLQILASIVIIFTAQSIVQMQLEAITNSPDTAMLPAGFQERIINLYTNSGTQLIIFLAIFDIVLNVLIFKFAIENKILRKKGLLIAFSIICFFTTESQIVSILSVVNFIVLLCLKRVNSENYPEKYVIPSLEYIKPERKEIILGVALLIVYFSQFLIDELLPENISPLIVLSIIIFLYIFIIGFAIFVFKDKLKRDIKLFKENFKAYLQFTFPKIGLMYLVFVLANLICITLTKKATSENQSMLESMPNWFLIPMAVIWAPIVEELVFRGVFRRFIKNDIIFIATSGIIFGLLHAISEATIFNIVITTIPYSVLGCFLAYMYAKSDNICTDIISHSFFNAIGVTFTSLLMFIL